MAKNYTRKDIGFDETVADSAFSGLDSKEQPLRRRIFLGLFATISLLTLIAAGRLLTIGTAEHGHYAARAASNANAETSVIAPRGIISDRYGKPLVENRPIFSVFLRVDKMIQQSEEDKVLDATQNVLALDRNQIVTEIAATNFEEGNDILLKRDITREQVIAVQSLNLSSLRVENDYKRRYLGEAFSHLVGFVGQSDKDRLVKGRTGLEAYYDDRLRGEDGKRILPRNARGQVQGPETVTSPVPGQNLATTVDSELQEYFYRRMASGLQSLGRTSGVGLALNPKNGEVLALLSFPAFDPANVAAALKSENQPLFNRAVSGSYNPGSTIKPVHAVAALKEGVIVPDKEILSTGYIEIPNPYDPEHPSRFLDWKPQGWVDLYSAIARSSNVYFYEISGGFESQEGLGINRLRQYWEKFSLGKSTGIDLPGEAAGFLPDPTQNPSDSPWRIGDTYNVAIGQGNFMVTPLQLLDTISSIANGGPVYTPHLFLDAPQKTLFDLSDLAPELKEVRRGMEDAVREPYGTAHLLADLPFRVAAKTGSAQTAGNTKINALFVGYAPAADPRIAVLVLIEDAREGSLNAVPIAKDVLSWYYEHRLKE